MPRIELYDATNTVYRIDTFDWEQIRIWFAEWLPRLRAPDIALRVMIYPLFSQDKSYPAQPDWNADTRFFEPFVIPDTAAEAIAAIHARGLEIEAAKQRLTG